MQLNHRVDGFAQIIVDAVCTDSSQKYLNIEFAMKEVMETLRQLRTKKNTLYIVGNGGSAAVASHALIDFVNVAKINTQVLHESSLITCMANDYGYQNAYSRVLSEFLKPNDMLIAISSSGKSSNICNAAKIAKYKGAFVMTLTGFDMRNPLRHLGHFNFWLDSTDYGYVEIGHQFVLHNLSDRFGEENKDNITKKDKAFVVSNV